MADSLNPDNVPEVHIKRGDDWFTIHNPKIPRKLDVALRHTLHHESVVCCVRFSSDGKYLATGCNRTAQIFEARTGAKMCVLKHETANKRGELYIRSVCFSPDGKYLATGAEDGIIRIWSIAERRVHQAFEGHTLEIYGLSFSNDGRFLVSGSGDKTTRVWKLGTARAIVLVENEKDELVTSVAISPDGRLVAAGNLEPVVRIWDANSGRLIDRLKGHEDSVYSVAFTPDGKGLISGSLDKTAKHWDLSALLRALDRDTPLSEAVTDDSEAQGGDGERENERTLDYVGHEDFVLSVAVSHDGKWVASGSKDESVRFWDVTTGEEQLSVHGHKKSVISIDLCPDGGAFATGSGDWQARLWAYSEV